MRFILKRLLTAMFSVGIVVLIASSEPGQPTVARPLTTIGHLSPDRGQVSSAMLSVCPVEAP